MTSLFSGYTPGAPVWMVRGEFGDSLALPTDEWGAANYGALAAGGGEAGLGVYNASPYYQATPISAADASKMQAMISSNPLGLSGDSRALWDILAKGELARLSAGDEKTKQYDVANMGLPGTFDDVMSNADLWNSPWMQNYAASRIAAGNKENMFGDLLQGLAWVGGGALGINALFNPAGVSGILGDLTGTATQVAAPVTTATPTVVTPTGTLGAIGGTDAATLAAADAAGGLLTPAQVATTVPAVTTAATPAVTTAATPAVTTTATTAAGTGTLGAIGGTGTEALAAADAAGGLLTPAQVAASAAATPGILTQLATALGTTPTALSGLLSGGLNLAGGLLSANAASDAADKQAATQLAIADMMRFRPVGVTTRFGSSQFGYDPTTGNLTSAGYTLSPETKALQDSLMGAAPGLLSQFTGSQAATAPMGTAAQAAMNLGNQYLATSPQAQAAKYMAEQMALLQPYNERNLANLEAKLQAQGRLGLATGGTSTLGASNPELEALYNAQKMQQLQLAAAATQGGMDYAKFGTAMAGAGGDLLNSMYGTQVAAFNPYNTALTGANTLEGMGQQAMNLGTTLGAQQTTANTPAANLMGQAAATQAAGNAVSPWGALLSGAGNAIQNYQTQQQQQQYQNSLLAALTNGNSQWGK